MKLPEPFTYFIDRSLGRGILVAELLKAGEQVHVHDEHFAQDTPDADWLVEVGRRRWVVLTKDKNIRFNELERQALVSARVACFMLGRGNLTAQEMAQSFIGALPRMKRVLRRYAVPLAASVTASAGVRVLLAGGVWLKPPREVK
ncbi:MAG: hypothetical protein HY908_01710 [Myxococcales bacterium]|nr:hypothetical protein [Myxococcales bacterium]